MRVKTENYLGMPVEVDSISEYVELQINNQLCDPDQLGALKEHAHAVESLLGRLIEHLHNKQLISTPELAMVVQGHYGNLEIINDNPTN